MPSTSPTRCRQVRTRHTDWSMQRLAVYAGVSLGVIERMELSEKWSDISQMDLQSFTKVADALGVTTSYLVPRLKEVYPLE